MSDEVKLTTNGKDEFYGYEDCKNIKSSMQFDSGTKICDYRPEEKDFIVSIEVRGEVSVMFTPDLNDNPEKGSTYSYPSEFPQKLKDIISGKEQLYLNGEKLDYESGWELDDRVNVQDNNWFEMTIRDENGSYLTSEVIDCEGKDFESLMYICKNYLDDYKRDSKYYRRKSDIESTRP